MSNEIILVTGGARSGKSRCAEALLTEIPDKFYLATCPVLDDEMAQRVRRHRADRAAAAWTTIEEPVELAAAVRQAVRAGAGGLLIDCLTLWINNLLYRNPELGEDELAALLAALLPELENIPGPAVLVINEVGLGIVPDSPLARRFRDLSGRCAQTVAAAADAVYFCLAGIQQRIK